MLFVYLENGFASDAFLRETATKEATAYFIELLQRGEAEFLVERDGE